MSGNAEPRCGYCEKLILEGSETHATFREARDRLAAHCPSPQRHRLLAWAVGEADWLAKTGKSPQELSGYVDRLRAVLEVVESMRREG